MRNHVKPGFSAIEFVIGMMISAMMLTATLTMYNQISKSCSKIQNITAKDLAIIILQKRISDDLRGLCPLWFTKEDIKDTTAAKADAQSQPNTKNNNYFYAQTKDEQLDFMTFISTNTLSAYPSAEHHIARIVYILKKDEAKENLLLLQRKEEAQISNEFNLEKIKEGKFYTVIKNIKKCVLEYGFIEQQDEKEEKNSSKEFKIKWVKQWSEKEEKEKKESEKKDRTPDLPEIIKLTVTLQEFTDQPEMQYTFYASLPQSKNISINSLAKKRSKKEAASRQSNLSNANNIINRIQNVAQQTTKGPSNA
jgi:hypothetical protein